LSFLRSQCTAIPTHGRSPARWWQSAIIMREKWQSMAELTRVCWQKKYTIDQHTIYTIFIIILWSDEPAKICLFLVGVPRLSSSAFCLNLISGKSHRTTLGRKQTQLQTGW
jgi:hypothetical protein